MKNNVITFSLLCFFLAIWNQNTNAQCPDITCSTLAITNLNGKDISYAYEIKNVGTDTLFLSKIIFQNYVKPDSSGSTAYAGGGAFVYYGSADFLLPDKKLAGIFHANSNLATEPCSFLLLSLSYTGKTECKTDNNNTVKRLEIEPAVDAQFTSDVTTGIAPVTVHFTDMSTNKPTEWKWDFTNDGITDTTSQNSTYVYRTPGTYSVKLVSSKIGSKDSIIKTSYIVVDAQVDAQFNADVTTGTAPLTVHFTDQSTGSPILWKWDFNNDGIVDSTSKNPSFVYKTPGTYAIKLIALKTGSSDTIVKTSYIIVVDTPVDAQFKADVTTGTVPLTVHFTDQSTGSPTSWKWDFNNDGIVDSTSKNPSFVYKTAGTYAVKLIALKTGSSDTIVKTTYIIVNQQLPSAVKSLKDEDWLVYPNPSDGPIYVKLGEKISKQSVTIEAYDNGGKLIFSVKSVNQSDIKLDFDRYQAGIYTIKVTYGRKILVKKVIRK